MSEKKYSPEEVEKIKTRILESLEQVDYLIFQY